jgi:beta-lactamase class D
MRRETGIALIIALIACPGSPAQAEPDYARLFAGCDGCFELYDLNANKLIVRSNPSRCARRFSPCSTFKVPLSLMAFDAGILQDENSSMKWDGTRSSHEQWNQDQTAASWMQYSVVWFSQRLTPQLGMRRVKRYLERFHYGNQDMSGGLTKAWLQSSLLISPDEQLNFWRRFWREALPLSKHAYDMTKKVTLVTTSPSGWTLNGKTGSGDLLGKDGRRVGGMGWFVGHIARGGQEYVFVTNYSDVAPPPDETPPGPVARDITMKILGQMGLY